MKHVLVETNWVVEYAKPAHLRLPAALTLARRAEAGELRIYIPSVCLAEARDSIRKKFQPRHPANAVRKYLRWASAEGTLNAEDSVTVHRVLDRYEANVLAELDRVDERIGLLRNHLGIEVFPLGDEMLVRAVELSVQNLDLEPFDQAFLRQCWCAPRRCEIRARMTSPFVSSTGISSLGTRTVGVSNR